MKGYYQGYFSLLPILVLSGLGFLVLWFNQSNLQRYQHNLWVRNDELSVQHKLFRQYQQEAKFCQPIATKDIAFSEKLTITGKYVTSTYYIDCIQEKLFNTLPDKIQNQPVMNYLNPNYAITQPVYSQPLYTSATAPLLWIIDQATVWRLDGTIYGVIMSYAELTIVGNGKIVGAIISDKSVGLGDKVSGEFNAAVVKQVNTQFSYWRVAKGGWHDF